MGNAHLVGSLLCLSAFADIIIGLLRYCRCCRSVQATFAFGKNVPFHKTILGECGAYDLWVCLLIYILKSNCDYDIVYFEEWRSLCRIEILSNNTLFIDDILSYTS